MSRIVSVWLPRWPIQRILAAQAKKPSSKQVDPERPFVLAVAASGGPRLTALNEAAEAFGLAIGEPLADARAKAEFLQVRDVDAAADDDALRRLALWATRYTPTASPWHEENGADGFFLDIEGSAHLFGGDESLIVDLSARLGKSFGLHTRIAAASTPGAAWALSRFHAAHCCVLPSGQEIEALSPLPIEALRLAPDIRATLRRLGFKTVGTLVDKPRAPFAARFPAELLRRLDQALGRVDEPLVPVIAPPIYHSLRYLLEPIITQEAIVALASRQMQTLAHVLTRDDVGARALRLSLYNIDGTVETIDIALTLPTRNAAHVARLIDLKLDTLATTRDAGFGFEAIGLAVTRAEPMPARQTELNVDRPPEMQAEQAAKAPDASAGRLRGSRRAQMFQDDDGERCAALIDALRQRLGASSVRRFEPVASHIPERAEVLTSVVTDSTVAHPRGGSPSCSRDGVPRCGDPVLDSRLRGNERNTINCEKTAWPEPEERMRPLILLPHAEPTEVTALVPDGPPRRFCWRGVTHDVTGAQGPERIAGEWWLHRMPGPTRDYYVVEDADGHRFWLYREGLYGRETTAARWFVHGLFA